MTRRIKRVVTTLMAAALMLTSIFSASTVAFASSTENVEKETNAIVAIGDIPVSEMSDSTIAARSTQVGTGRSYLGHFTFYDQNRGLDRYYMGWHVRLCIAWKTDTRVDNGGDIDLNVKFFGKDMKFKCSEDPDGPDSDGYYYVTKEIGIIYGTHSSIIYDAVTREGWNPPGYLRSGDVHTWVDVW